MDNTKKRRLFAILSGALFIAIVLRSLVTVLVGVLQGERVLIGWSLAFWIVYAAFGVLLITTEKALPLTIASGALFLYVLAEGFQDLAQPLLGFKSVLLSILGFLPSLCIFLLLLSAAGSFVP